MQDPSNQASELDAEDLELLKNDMTQIEEKKPIFGVMVIGPSGSGKTTFCDGLQQFLQSVRRKNCVINLDPANDNAKYCASIDIKELVCLDDVMQELQLGPNGGLMYCLDFLNKNFDWLREKVLQFQDHFLIFDLPGQLELFLNSDSLKSIIEKLRTDLGSRKLRSTVVELFDSHYIQDPNKYLSACMYSLVSMINLELPHINVLSKVDLITDPGSLDFRISFYTDAQDFDALAMSLAKDETRFSTRYGKLSNNICGLLENYAMTSFHLLEVTDQTSVSSLLSKIDKCNGFVIDSSEEESKDVRELIYEANKRGIGLTKFEEKLEMSEEQKLQEELKLFEMVAKGEITEEQLEEMLAKLGGGAAFADHESED